jgi:hypothetical protein
MQMLLHAPQFMVKRFKFFAGFGEGSLQVFTSFCSIAVARFVVAIVPGATGSSRLVEIDDSWHTGVIHHAIDVHLAAV